MTQIEQAIEIIDFLEAELKLIANQSDTEMILDPTWAKRIAQDDLSQLMRKRAALSQHGAPQFPRYGSDDTFLCPKCGKPDSWVLCPTCQSEVLPAPEPQVLDLNEVYTGLAQGVIKAIRAQLPGVEIKGVTP